MLSIGMPFAWHLTRHVVPVRIRLARRRIVLHTLRSHLCEKKERCDSRAPFVGRSCVERDPDREARVLGCTKSKQRRW